MVMSLKGKKEVLEFVNSIDPDEVAHYDQAAVAAVTGQSRALNCPLSTHFVSENFPAGLTLKMAKLAML